ncbi:endospore germination permease [Clostridium cochlearium]|uniref:Spore germination protein (Amino acid permease) n=1 Tax=Clostridium cochlearium TaxID=1494 RepID=A0ABY0QIN5_CLOCO|nr:endospore germination permease [Clostridium cochlearium]NME95792.1 endospore germination permease [Clostridium cochlearium]SDK89601.1 spore germination protein (amino acid permease) [Clostridium cochlearium]
MDNINAKHLFFIISAITIVSLKTYPTIFIRNAGRDSWLVVIAASLIIIFSLIFMLKSSLKTNTFDFYDIYRNSFGKILGTILYFFFIFSLFLTLIECAGIESSSMHTNILMDTPTWYIALFIVFTAIYPVKKGHNSVLAVTIIGIVLMIIAGINLAVLTSTYKNYKYLFPILENGLNKNIFLALLKVLGLYAHVVIFFPYLKFVHNKDKIFKVSIWSMIFIIQMEIISIIGVLSTFEVNHVKNLVYPKLLQTQLISYWRFLESGEFFVMLQTVGGWYVKYILVLNILNKSFEKIFSKSKYLIYIISILSYTLTSFLANKLLRFFAFLNFYSIISFINFFLIPFIAFTILHFKKNKSISI